MNGPLAMRLFGVAAAVVAGIALPGASVTADDGVDAILRASRAALGVDALPRIRTLHLRGAVVLAGVKGSGDTWQDVRTGTYAQVADAGPAGGAQGYDGTHVWNRDTSGFVWDEGGAGTRYAALDQAYLNRYLLWMPDRGGATVAPGGTKTDQGRRYDVVRVTPKDSLTFDVWFDATTHLPARTVTTIGNSTTVATFADYRSVRGLRVPFRQSSDTDGDASSFVASRADADDSGAAAALRRPVSHVTDFTLPSGTTTIPFELGDYGLPVTINGKGPFRFAFDTGGRNVIDGDVARQLGLGAAGSVAGGGVGAATENFQFASVDTLRVGGATLRKQVFVVAPIHAGFGVSGSKPIDGLIGFEVLARFVTTFDYGNNRVELNSTGFAPDGPSTVPFVFYRGHPMIDCTIAGIAGKCVLDTGSRIGLSVLTPFLAAHPSIVPPGATAVGANGFGVGGPALGRLARITLQFAGYGVNDVIADLSTQTKGAFADPFKAGNIGAAVLKRFNVTFDYAHQRVSFVPNGSFGARETYERSGTFLITQGGKIVVADVRPGTPAADAGLARGEVISTVGGTDAAALGLAGIREAFRGAPGTAIVLGITAKDGTARTVTLTLRDYV